jgi:hypothetical protein
MGGCALEVIAYRLGLWKNFRAVYCAFFPICSFLQFCVLRLRFHCVVYILAFNTIHLSIASNIHLHCHHSIAFFSGSSSPCPIIDYP